MKLGELRGAIRKAQGNPFIRVSLGSGIPTMELVLQKSALDAALKQNFGDNKATETGLELEDGWLRGTTPNAETVAALGDSRAGLVEAADDLDDLLSDDADEDDLLL